MEKPKKTLEKQKQYLETRGAPWRKPKKTLEKPKQHWKNQKKI
jgi:hypothetical protein